MSLNGSSSPALGHRPGRRSVTGQSRIDLIGLAIVASAGLVIAAHLTMGLDAPLWLDESWTGALASVHTVTELVHQAREEAGAPAYYVLIWIWAKAFGVSNVSLHSSGLIVVSAAPLIAWAGLKRSRPSTALAWAVLLAIWGPGIAQSGYARCYPLLLCAAVATTVTYIHLLDAPKQKQANIWAALAAVTILTHYYAILLIVVQGVILLIVHRRRVLLLWPAALIFVPAFAWIGWNIPRLTLMTSPDLAWYHILSGWNIPVLCSYLLGVQSTQLLPFAAAALLTHVLARRRADVTAAVAKEDGSIPRAGVAALLAASILVAAGMLRPMFTQRYLILFEPGIALLIAHWMSTISAGHRPTLGLLLCGSVLFSALFWIGPWPLRERVYNFELASKWITQASPSRLTFFWDNPTATTVARDQLSLVGGFFFERDGMHVRVDPTYPVFGADMNEAIMKEAKQDAAILWLYDLQVHSTTAITHRPELETLDPGLECRDFGAGPIGVLACRRKTAAL